MADCLLQTAALIIVAAIFWRAEHILNLMAPACRFPIRLAFWLLAVGALASGLQVWRGYVPPAGVIVLWAGVALLLTGERRIRAVLRIKG